MCVCKGGQGACKEEEQCMGVIERGDGQKSEGRRYRMGKECCRYKNIHQMLIYYCTSTSIPSPTQGWRGCSCSLSPHTLSQNTNKHKVFLFLSPSEGRGTGNSFYSLFLFFSLLPTNKQRTNDVLEAVHLDRILLGKFVRDQKCRNVFALISLQLENFAKFFVFHNTTVAAVFCIKWQGREWWVSGG